MRILVVDDNRALAEDLAEILAEEGHEPVVVETPQDALATADASFALMLVDVRLPGMDGVELFQKLREKAPDAHFLLMTAYADHARLLEARQAGVEAIFPKPVPIGRLVGYVAAAESQGGVLLLVEDDEALGADLEELLEDHWTVRRARTLAEAQDLAEAQPVAAAVVDLRLPDGTSVELVRHLSARKANVVVVTGLPEATAARLVGALAPLIIKPFASDALVARLGAVAASHGPR